MKSQKKGIAVAAALIRRENEVFATQRGYGSYKDWWEFPGGKIEAGETPEEALVREIREELAVNISVDTYITTVEYDYPEFHLSMACYWCSVKEGHLTLLEHEAARWLPIDDLRQVNWLPADILVIEEIERSGSVPPPQAHRAPDGGFEKQEENDYE
ncbi:MAG: (deoxy)nucleoside triphosphate pyrophosphohydrolase [Eubacterium sp.]|nr:(deoxy)nucleoside triphosphate pyrophosphohydrolase [Eubacterium sp.]